MENIEITSVSSRGQIVIPQSLRNRLKIVTKLISSKNVCIKFKYSQYY